MKCHRIDEVMELLKSAWENDSDLSLLQFLVKLGQEAGFEGDLKDLGDEVLIYHLKMRDADKSEVIPGLKKDYEEDFKTALLKARGIIKE
ncbi:MULTISPECIES: YihD family protein [unclassified Gilliamella]|uniref:YihD family protein n=1 Tax=unclassified Gilliamella TaxID=2685620 RepID=UPI00080E30D6|nr:MULTISPECIES: YihD family protein [Gilliamella]MCX8643053.1 YihD family protein [Gilliamella sp. B3835]MCX8708444.1 YihD family protein [Gilliamella sp. B3783]MCX8709700.1 YihD family protein [Gilliamella sp. B3780]MCX8713084.1 YihD family protein [Gilliamella sp. B3468]MCX8714112.1 YihD family protein [Gilliamella sp. B3781]